MESNKNYEAQYERMCRLASKLNADPEDDWTYVARRKSPRHFAVVQAYDEDNNFVGNVGDASRTADMVEIS